VDAARERRWAFELLPCGERRAIDGAAPVACDAFAIGSVAAVGMLAAGVLNDAGLTDSGAELVDGELAGSLVSFVGRAVSTSFAFPRATCEVLGLAARSCLRRASVGLSASLPDCAALVAGETAEGPCPCLAEPLSRWAC
jgi:hypothetical protein